MLIIDNIYTMFKNTIESLSGVADEVIAFMSNSIYTNITNALTNSDSWLDKILLALFNKITEIEILENAMKDMSTLVFCLAGGISVVLILALPKQIPGIE